MIFHRTSSGLSNLHLFYGVDAIVFTEGGESCAVADIIKGKFTSHADDIKFWRLLFDNYAPGKKCHLRGVGSRSGLINLAAYVMANAVSNVFICMDRDLQHLQDGPGMAPIVVCTFGYSWENCVWTSPVVLLVFERLNTSGTDVSEIQGDVDRAFEIAAKRLRWFAWASHLLVLNGATSFKIESSLGSVVAKSSNLPTINMGHLRELVHQAHSTISRPVHIGHRFNIRPLEDCYGHLLGKFGYHLLAYLLRRHCKFRSLPIDVVTPVAIDAALGYIKADKARNHHYSLQFSRLKW